MMENFTSRFIGFLERLEAGLLSWGFYDVSFEASELEELIKKDETGLREEWEAHSDTWADIASLCGDLAYHGLLHRAEPGRETFRTRFAEGVRLTARLKQMFKPQHWASGARLVSDIKVHLEPRRYPKRDQPPADCLHDLERLFSHSELQSLIFNALSSNSGRSYDGFATFQRGSFAHILSHYDGRGPSGTVISAGTGSGKTKAFYIPAFLGIVGDLADPKPFTKVIAIYPRNVLLADQLREALAEASKIRPILLEAGLRPLTFGALLGDTPYKLDLDNWDKKQGNAWRRWEERGGGYVIPYLKSPLDPGQELVWRKADRTAGKNCLYRASGGGVPDVPDGELVITRDDLMNSPPDILFLSLEMLNREMGSPAWRRTFGFSRDLPRPRLLLLDEVHSYEGVSGAQAAWALRRWRYWSGWGRNLHVVGLSATLKEARQHLGAVTGIPASSITEFRPAQTELDEEGMEYSLLVKGDPGSGASLLATTIQTGVLLSRLMNPRGATATGKGEIQPAALHGRKVFGFTDNLDSLNRWYSDMLDADGVKRLARLRVPPSADTPTAVKRAINAEGQSWELPVRLGHDLTRPLRITRCSSQDPGADSNSDMIIATSSLEVGYDDPDVGAILHHKRPRSLSSFIQRKGRAGRRRGVRPMTVVVLSDYGGDRWAFQQPERLFRPEIDAIDLPLLNPYILRIQAAFFLVDWIGRRVGKGSPFSYLRRPSVHGTEEARVLLNALLDQGREWERFRADFEALFSRPLGSEGRTLTEMELDDILWGDPRPLIRQAVPCLLRKLDARFGFADPKRDAHEDAGINHPLPGFLPRSTFADLDASDVIITFDGSLGKAPSSLGVSQALFEVCPGKVSKRYSVGTMERGYWHGESPRLLTMGNARAKEFFPESIFLGNFRGVDIYQPVGIKLAQHPREVLKTSSASWNWENCFRPLTQGLDIPIFNSEPFLEFFTECQAFLHRDHSGIEVVRYASRLGYEIRKERGVTIRGQFSFAATGDNGTIAEGIGFRLAADGIGVRIRPEALRRAPPTDQSQDIRYRADYYLHRVRSCPFLSSQINEFLAEWIWRVSLAMLSASAFRNRCSLERAQELLAGRRDKAAERVLESIFQVIDLSATTGATVDEAKLKKRIGEAWRNPAVVDRLEELEKTLWGAPDSEYEDWLRRRFASTLAQAFRKAASDSVLDISGDDLLVDLAWHDDGGAWIYLTEASSGGLGQIEMIARDLLGDTERFLDGFRHALAYCERDETGSMLLGVARTAMDDSTPLAEAFQQIRSSSGFLSLEQAKKELCGALEKTGFPSTRSFIVAVVTRLLQPASSSKTDSLVHMLNEALARGSHLLGLAVDPRVFAYWCVSRDSSRRRLASVLREISGGIEPDTAQLYNVLQRFFMPDCKDSCPECLHSPNPYGGLEAPSRALALAWMDLEVTEIDVDKNPETWIDIVRQELIARMEVRITAGSERLSSLALDLQRLLAEELEVGCLLVPVAISKIRRNGGGRLTVTLAVKDMPHGW